MKVLAVLLCALVSVPAHAQINAGEQKPEANLPFTMTQVTTLNLPWRIAFLPDGRMLITEKVGPVWLVTQKGEKTEVANAPAVLYGGQGGMLGVFTSPRYGTDHHVYLTYSEPGEGGRASRSRAPSSRSPATRRASKGSRCCGIKCRRARAVSSARRSRSLPTGNTYS